MSEEKNPLEPTAEEEAFELAMTSLAVIPYPVGGVFSSVANHFFQKRRNRRINKFVMDLANDWESFKDQINQNFIRSDGFEDLVENIFSKVSECMQQEKIDSYRAIFMNTVLSDTPDYDEAAEIASLIERWQPRHIVLLKILANPRRADEEMGNPVGEGVGNITSFNQILLKLLPDWDSEKIDRTLLELYDARIHGISSTRGTMSGRGIRHLEGILTDYGQRVVRYLTNPAAD